MFRTLFSRTPAAGQWTDDAQRRVERASVRLFAAIGTQCSARAFRVPNPGGDLLLVELRADVQWTSESLDVAKTILIQGLNSSLGFKLRPDDLVLGFAKTRPGDKALGARASVPTRAPIDAPETAVEVTEFGESHLSAFFDTQAPPPPTDGGKGVKPVERKPERSKTRG